MAFFRKILLYLYYFVRSCSSRGIPATFRMMWQEYEQEKRWQISTLSIAELDQLQLASTATEAHHYQAASYYVLQQIFEHLPFSVHNTTFIDFGAGKGRAMILAAQFGCRRVIGIELAKELCDIATQNIAHIQASFPHTQFEVLFADATHYDIPADAQIFYFFNPFGPNILEQVLRHIQTSVHQFPRPICIIYLNPVHQKVVEKMGFQIHHILKNRRYTEAILYSFTG